MADRAAIVTGASSGIGLAIAHVLGEEGYGADRRRAAAGQARGGRRGAARARATRSRWSPATSATRTIVRRSSRRTASASAASTCSSTTPASGIGAAGRRARRPSASTSSSTVNLRSIDPLLPRGAPTCCKAAGAEHQQRARGQHGVDRRQARRGVAVGLLARPSSAVVGFTAGDEQGAQRRRASSRARSAPAFVDTADDRLRQGARAGRGDDPTPGRRRVGAHAAAPLARLRHPGDPSSSAPGADPDGLGQPSSRRSTASSRLAPPRRASARSASRRSRSHRTPSRRGRLATRASDGLVLGDRGAQVARPRSTSTRLPRGGRRGRAARARWPGGRAVRAGEAVPGPREGEEARAPAAAVGGQHRAHAAAAVGVGADDDRRCSRDALEHRLARAQRQAVDRAVGGLRWRRRRVA